MQEIDWTSSRQRLIRSMHMALDEFCSARDRRERAPTLRIWEWIEPALVIGSHQSVANEVDVLARASRLCRDATDERRRHDAVRARRTITYSLYLPESVVAGVTFRKSYAMLDDWAVRAFVELGVPAEYREINDIISPRGKIAAPRKRAPRVRSAPHDRRPLDGRRAASSPHPIGRPSVAATGVRSGTKPCRAVLFTTRTCAESPLDLA